jgi:hypothetical protein
MAIMAMKLAHLYLKVIADAKEITITITTTTAIVTTITMTEMSIQNIIFRKRTVVTAQTRAAALSPHVLIPSLHALILHAPHAKRARPGLQVL